MSLSDWWWGRANRAKEEEAVLSEDEEGSSANAVDQEPAVAEVSLPRELLWLLDAPMFIDEIQVEAFYDAVLRPDYEGASVTLSESLSSQTTFGGELTLEAAIPWFAKSAAKAKGERATKRDEGQQAVLTSVTNPYRHLLALAMHYATEKQTRLVLASPPDRASDATGQDVDWSTQAFSESTPRALVVLDLRAGLKLIPTALELRSGKVVLLFDKFKRRLEEQSPGAKSPTYPSGAAPGAPARDDYWQWFVEKFDHQQALETIEEAVEGGPITWIDFRTPLGRDAGPFLHLHIATRGKYETGIFGYNFVSRGHKHGLRIVGTLKSEPDLNVLAIFER